MKVLSIESPQRLKDRTVKASIIVSEENYIPLIMLADKAYKGDAIEIDNVRDEYHSEDTPASIIMDTIMDASTAVIEAQLKIAEAIGYQKAKDIMFDSSEIKESDRNKEEAREKEKAGEKEEVDIWTFPKTKIHTEQLVENKKEDI